MSRTADAGAAAPRFAARFAARLAAGALILLACVPGPAAQADGPHIAFHATQGGYTVTLFSAPDPLVAGPAGLTLLVQDAADGSLAVSPTAAGQAALPGHAPVAFRLTPGGASNRRLLGGSVRLSNPGTYSLTLTVAAQGGGPVTFRGTLPVERNEGKRNTVLWAVFLPVALIALFLVNQQAKLRLRRARAQAGTRAGMQPAQPSARRRV